MHVTSKVKDMNKTTLLAIMAVTTSAYAAEFDVSVVATPNGWNVEEAVQSDLDAFRENGRSESQLQSTGDELRRQYSQLSTSGTQGVGTVSIEATETGVRYGGYVTWSHLRRPNSPVEGIVSPEGSIVIRRQNGDDYVQVSDLLTSGTLLSPLDYAIIGQNRELAFRIVAEHEARQVFVNGVEVPLYQVDVSQDASGTLTGYEIRTAAPTEFTEVSFARVDGEWRKTNFRPDGQVDRETVLKPSNGSPFAFSPIAHGAQVSDHRDHQLGAVAYTWSGELPSQETLASLRKGGETSEYPLLLVGMAGLGAGVWVLMGTRKK